MIYALYVNQGTTVRVEYGDAAIAADPAGAHVISQAFPHTYGQPLAHFLRKTAVVPDAKVISEHPAVRYYSIVFMCMSMKLICLAKVIFLAFVSPQVQKNIIILLRVQGWHCLLR
jgi:hypothetical protein